MEKERGCKGAREVREPWCGAGRREEGGRGVGSEGGGSVDGSKGGG